MAKTIYVCEFRTGKYSDRSDIAMVAFRLKKDAQNFVEQANNYLKENGMFWGSHPSWELRKDGFEFPDLKGQTFTVDYTGAKVSVYPLELRGM